MRNRSHIELPTVMDEVEDLCYNLLEKLKSIDLKQSDSTATASDAPKETDASSESNPHPNKNADQFHYILNMAIGMSKITEKLAGKHRDGLFIPADRNIAATYPDALKRIFYGGIKSDLHTRACNPVHVPISILSHASWKKMKEFLDIFSTQNFQSLFDEKDRGRIKRCR